MFEKYNTLSLVQLREIVKAQGIKNTSTMRLSLIHILLNRMSCPCIHKSFLTGKIQLNASAAHLSG